MQLTYKCYLCNKTFTRNNGLVYHLKFTHNTTFKNHYDKYNTCERAYSNIQEFV